MVRIEIDNQEQVDIDKTKLFVTVKIGDLAIEMSKKFYEEEFLPKIA